MNHTVPRSIRAAVLAVFCAALFLAAGAPFGAIYPDNAKQYFGSGRDWSQKSDGTDLIVTREAGAGKVTLGSDVDVTGAIDATTTIIAGSFIKGVSVTAEETVSAYVLSHSTAADSLASVQIQNDAEAFWWIIDGADSDRLSLRKTAGTTSMLWVDQATDTWDFQSGTIQGLGSLSANLLTIDNLTLDGAAIASDTGTVGFSGDNIGTVGNITATGAITGASVFAEVLVVGTTPQMVIQGGSITDSSGAISFGNEALTTTGTITAGTFTDGTFSTTAGVATTKKLTVAEGSAASPATITASCTATGQTSAISSVLGLTYSNASTVASLSHQCLRFIYYADAGATASAAGDFGMVVYPSISETMLAFYNYTADGAAVATGKTLSTQIHYNAGAPTGLGSITSRYGLKFDDSTVTSCTNQFVVYCADLVGATNNWCIYNAGTANNWLGHDDATTSWGTGQDAAISYDGTDLQIDPQVVGSGLANVNGAISRKGLFYAYASNEIAGATSWTTVDCDTVDEIDSDYYSEAAGVVTLLRDGRYRLTHRVDFAHDGTADHAASAALYVDTGGGATQIKRSHSGQMLSIDADVVTHARGTATAVTQYSFNANDTVELKAITSATTVDIGKSGDEPASLEIEYLRDDS